MKNKVIKKTQLKEPNYAMGFLICAVGALVYFLFFKNASSGPLRGVILVVCAIVFLCLWLSRVVKKKV